MAEKAPVSQEEMENVREDKEMETPEETNEAEEETADETSQEETPEEKSKELQSALAQKDHWRKKAEVAEKKLKSEPKPETKEGSDEWKQKVEFLLQNQKSNYSEEEVDHITNVSSRKGISLQDAAKQEDEYIQFNREKVVKEKGTPSSSSPASSVGGKTPEEIENMSDKEYSAYLKEDRKNFKVGGRGV